MFFTLITLIILFLSAVLSFVAIPRVFPYIAGQISFSSVLWYMLGMSYVINIQLVIQLRQ